MTTLRKSDAQLDFQIIDARCHCGRFVKVERVMVNKLTDAIMLVAATCSKHREIWCKDYGVWP